MLTCSTIQEFEGRWQGAQQVAKNASNLNAAALEDLLDHQAGPKQGLRFCEGVTDYLRGDSTVGQLEPR